MFEDYNPYYFDEYCSNYVLCEVSYDDKCQPVDAIGFDAMQTRQLEAFVVGVPSYVVYMVGGLAGAIYLVYGYIYNGLFDGN